jgi:type III secretion system low calcium response chaperone LcrH/SycD
MEIDREKIEEAARKIAGDMTTVRELKGITDAEMDAVYSLGFNFYRTGNIENAEKVFKFLVLFDHFEPKYWIGMGAVLQVKKMYDGAITAYAYASFLDIHDPKPQYHAAECYLAKGDRANAASALAALERFAPEDTDRGREYRAKAEELKKLIDGDK